MQLAVGNFDGDLGRSVGRERGIESRSSVVRRLSPPISKPSNPNVLRRSLVNQKGLQKSWSQNTILDTKVVRQPRGSERHPSQIDSLDNLQIRGLPASRQNLSSPHRKSVPARHLGERRAPTQLVGSLVIGGNQAETFPSLEISVVAAMSGEVLATIGGASLSWTGSDIEMRLLEKAPLELDQHYKLVCGTETLDSPSMLADFGAANKTTGKLEISAFVVQLKKWPDVINSFQELEKLKDPDFKEVFALKCPPPAVALLFEAMCCLLSIPAQTDSYWKTAISVFKNKATMLRMLSDFDVNRCDAAGCFAKIARFLDDPTLTPDQIKRVSLLCKHLSVWLFAVGKALQTRAETNE